MQPGLFMNLRQRLQTGVTVTEKEKAQKGFLYNANFDKEIIMERRRCQELCYSYNNLKPSNRKKRKKILRKILDKPCKNILIEQPFRCDFGYRIHIGKCFYANYNLIILDGAEVTIGSHVFIGPNCGIYAAGHPLDVEQRNEGLEYAYPVKIGNHVWIGGNVTIIGGVIIGEGAVIGAGSVVVKDIPPYTLAAGNPCRVIRNIVSG